MTSQLWAANFDKIVAGALRQPPDYADPISCRHWLLGVHAECAWDAAERMVLLGPIPIDENQSAALLSRSQGAIDLMITTGLQNLESIGNVPDDLVAAMVQTITGNFRRRFLQIARAASQGGRA